MEQRKKPSVQLADFISSTRRNEWLNRPWGQVYVRNARRILENRATLEDTLDIASVEVKESWRSIGCFTRWLRTVENVCRDVGRTIYVENVLEERFRKFFVKQGYTLTSHSADHCFYKRIAYAPSPESIQLEKIRQSALNNE